MNIPLVDLAAQHAEVADEVDVGLAEVFATTAFIGGKAVKEFEQAYAEPSCRPLRGSCQRHRRPRARAARSGCAAGGEVIMPANTFIATAEAASRIGAVPVPVDVDPDYLLIDPARSPLPSPGGRRPSCRSTSSGRPRS